MSEIAWVVLVLVLLLVFGRWLAGWVRLLLRLMWPVAALLVLLWLITSGRVEQLL